MPESQADGLKSVTLRDLIERKVEGLGRSLRGSKGGEGLDDLDTDVRQRFLGGNVVDSFAKTGDPLL